MKTVFIKKWCYLHPIDLQHPHPTIICYHSGCSLATAVLGTVTQDYNLLLLHKETQVPGEWLNLLPSCEVSGVLVGSLTYIHR